MEKNDLKIVDSTTHPHHVNPILSLLSVSANIGDLELNAAHKKLVWNWNRELRHQRTEIEISRSEPTWDAPGAPSDSDDILSNRKISALADPLNLIQKTEEKSL